MLISRVHLALAIADVEGWFSDHFLVGPPPVHTPNRPQRNNSPGNLRWAPERFPQTGMDIHHNEPGSDPGYVVFPTKESGWAASENDIYAKLLKKEPDYPSGWTLRKLIHVYCPVGDGANAPEHYVELVTKRLPLLKSDLPLKPIVIEEGRILGPWKLGPGWGTAHSPDWKNLDNWIAQEVKR